MADAEVHCGLDQMDRELMTVIFFHLDTADVARARVSDPGWTLGSRGLAKLAADCHATLKLASGSR